MNIDFFKKYVSSNSSAFFEAVQLVSNALKINPDWLLTVMWLESRINPQAINPYNQATGLIQFIRSTAISLGTSIEELKLMSNVEQMDFVYKYYLPYKGKIKSFIDLYLVTFFPLAVGKPDDWVIQSKGISAKAVALGNKAYDLDKNEQITVGEFKAAVLKRLPEEIKKIMTDTNIEIAIGILIVLIGLLILYKIFK